MLHSQPTHILPDTIRSILDRSDNLKSNGYLLFFIREGNCFKCYHFVDEYLKHVQKAGFSGISAVIVSAVRVVEAKAITDNLNKSKTATHIPDDGTFSQKCGVNDMFATWAFYNGEGVLHEHGPMPMFEYDKQLEKQLIRACFGSRCGLRLFHSIAISERKAGISSPNIGTVDSGKSFLISDFEQGNVWEVERKTGQTKFVYTPDQKDFKRLLLDNQDLYGGPGVGPNPISVSGAFRTKDSLLLLVGKFSVIEWTISVDNDSSGVVYQPSFVALYDTEKHVMKNISVLQTVSLSVMSPVRYRGQKIYIGSASPAFTGTKYRYDSVYTVIEYDIKTKRLRHFLPLDSNSVYYLGNLKSNYLQTMLQITDDEVYAILYWCTSVSALQSKKRISLLHGSYIDASTYIPRFDYQKYPDENEKQLFERVSGSIKTKNGNNCLFMISDSVIGVIFWRHTDDYIPTDSSRYYFQFLNTHTGKYLGEASVTKNATKHEFILDAIEYDSKENILYLLEKSRDGINIVSYKLDIPID